ncbi:MAG: type II toxin-antitoxin system RelE/ParE family toxin [Flavobacteriales bacterium]
MKKRREIIIFKSYFFDFYNQQPEYVKLKIEWTIQLIRELERIPKRFFKHVESTKGIYEIRVEAESNTFRIFCFFDVGNIIVLGNAYQKKPNKLSKREIIRAIKIQEEYKYERQS